MSEQDEQHGDGAHKVQVRQISAGERRPTGVDSSAERMGSVYVGIRELPPWQRASRSCRS